MTSVKSISRATGATRLRRAIGIAAALLITSTSLTVFAQTAPVPIDGPIEQLKPGGYLWAPQIAPAKPVTVIISLNTQRAYAYRNGVPIGVATISSGKKGHRTPTGVFTVLLKAVDHKSYLYSDALMPLVQRLTWGGIAMHAGNLPGYLASNGCVRLPLAFAELLFGITRLGMTVVITDDAAVPVVAPTPAILEVTDANVAVAETEYVWQPEKSPTGPLSIVVSGQDGRIVVLRNGIEIGSGAVTTASPIVRAVAFTVSGVDAAGEHWLRLPLPGQPQEAAGELSLAERAQGHMPAGLQRAIATALTSGTTLLVTRASLRSPGTAQRFTIITAGNR